MYPLLDTGSLEGEKIVIGFLTAVGKASKQVDPSN